MPIKAKVASQISMKDYAASLKVTVPSRSEKAAPIPAA
jgi:hypothetical protein